MLNEKPIEWITKVEENPLHRIARIFCLVAAVFGIAVFLFISPMIILFAAFCVFLILFLLLQIRATVEYEFTFLSDELRVVVIYNRRRRKDRMVVRLNEIQYMIKKIEKGEEAVYCCDKRDDDRTYTLVFSRDGQRMHLVLQPDPDFVELLKMRRLVR
ncbi:MAG: hypothetical protein LUC83_07800 [Clostridiales bacterium]|nr:hypothetical protein [Clostridiales bacterium]